MLGLNKGEVKLVRYNPEWPELFQKEKMTLEGLIEAEVLGIEHIGSTAIEGIQAKPIIDILIGLKELDDVQSLGVKRMSEANYYMLQQQNLKGKYVFAKFPYIKEENYTKTHYLHVVQYEGDWWNAHIDFRDRLNETPELAKKYEKLKTDLAEAYPEDVITYSESKEQFIEDVLSGSI
ncbi:GrpB family protein [Alkalibacillus silvisoli]|uniref:GrpB family protein n=1 Tax=Alkalibacillus silvisoli TaxID=392823 RepID=A0ABP3JTH1_9BACI